jgi:hypothetical protein
VEQVGNRAGRRHARVSQGDIGYLRRGYETRLNSEPIAKETEQPPTLRLVEAGVLSAPAIEFEAAIHEAISLDLAPASAWTVFGQCAILDE